jgi:signal transduction histidine kinase
MDDTARNDRRHVLVVEGDDATRTELKASCRRCGMLPTLASDGHEAIQHFKQTRHGIVVVGMDLEDISGFMLIKRIKRLAWFTDFIFAAPHMSMPLALEAIRCFASDVLPLPAEPKEQDDALLRAANRTDIYRRIQKNDLDFHAKVEKQLKLISHDNKNYIHSARQSLDILAGELENGELRSLSSIMRKSILAHLEVAGQALEMSYQHNMRVLDEGLREDIHGAIDSFRDFDLCTLVRKCCKEMRSMADVRAVRLHLLMPDQKIPFFGLERGMYHVVANLVHNAIKFSPRGGEVRINLTPGTVDEDGVRTLTLRVSDDGDGFPEFRVDSLLTAAPPADDLKNDLETESRDKPAGTGFGLSFVRDIVERHVGHMQKGSSSSGGAAVSVYLPMLE